jgi:predicted ATPase
MRLRQVQIAGYKALREFRAPLGSLEVFVGANGTGKTSLFEFLRFLRDGMSQEIPPEIIPGSLGQQVFHRPGPDQITWELILGDLPYAGVLLGPVGQPRVASEFVEGSQAHLRVKGGVGRIWQTGKTVSSINLKKPNQLALSLATNPELETLYQLRELIAGWRFYSSFKIANEKIRQPTFVEQEPVLQEDAGNLSSVLHNLYTEHPGVFDDLQQHLQSVVPGFLSLSVKARGGPGQVLAFWREEGVDVDLALADLSDGILRLLCWIVLCVHPKPPGLICIDEPDQGVHPRTLPLLAGLFEKAADRTQILLATHASYFLLQFGIERIAVLRKENGEVKFFKPKDSEALTRSLEDFGPQEIEVMHRSDELEQLA